MNPNTHNEADVTLEDLIWLWIGDTRGGLVRSNKATRDSSTSSPPDFDLSHQLKRWPSMWRIMSPMKNLPRIVDDLYGPAKQSLQMADESFETNPLVLKAISTRKRSSLVSAISCRFVVLGLSHRTVQPRLGHVIRRLRFAQAYESGTIAQSS